jgi:hypothetical protein
MQNTEYCRDCERAVPSTTVLTGQAQSMEFSEKKRATIYKLISQYGIYYKNDYTS